MPRLFTGLEIPAPSAAALASARGGVHGARWIEPSDYHITLRFIGDVDLRAARDVADTLADIRRPPVRVSFEGLSWFGADKPRAIVAKIKPTRAADRAAGRARAAAAADRLAAGAAQFHPARDAGAASLGLAGRRRRLS